MTKTITKPLTLLIAVILLFTFSLSAASIPAKAHRQFSPPARLFVSIIFYIFQPDQ